MIKEHQIGRRAIAALADAVERFGRGESEEAYNIVKYSRAYSELLR